MKVWEWTNKDTGEKRLVKPTLDLSIWQAQSAQVTDLDTGERFYVRTAYLRQVDAPETPCSNCGRSHFQPGRNMGWPSCDPSLPHYAVMASGCEGRCMLCGDSHRDLRMPG